MNHYEIEQLVPQRPPILMVDMLLHADGSEALCSFVVKADNLFLDEKGQMSAAGLIEHIAQSASALFGYHALAKGMDRAPMAYIGEVKNFRCLRAPQVNETLLTTIILGPTVGSVTLLTGQTSVNGVLIAETGMKIGYEIAK